MVSAWQYQNPRDRDNDVSIGRTAEGINIAVSDEQAVDSYNDNFTCDIDIPVEQAILLRDWLIKNLPSLITQALAKALTGKPMRKSDWGNWNPIRFKDYKDRGLALTTNTLADDCDGDGPVVVEIRELSGCSQSHWMMPDSARLLAAKLIEAADACDRAGKRVRVSSEEADAQAGKE